MKVQTWILDDENENVDEVYTFDLFSTDNNGLWKVDDFGGMKTLTHDGKVIHGTRSERLNELAWVLEVWKTFNQKRSEYYEGVYKAPEVYPGNFDNLRIAFMNKGVKKIRVEYL